MGRSIAVGRFRIIRLRYKRLPCGSPTDELGRKTSHEVGAVSLITLAIILPIVLGAFFTALDLYLYFRAANVVQRAAAEAAQAIASAQPGDKNAYLSNTLAAGTGTSVGNSPVLTYWERYSGPANFANLVEQPFSVCRYASGCGATVNGNDVANKNPGVQYLPMTSVYTCLEPLNESDHTISSCGGTIMPDMAGFLTYLQPARLDFDGDGVEDITFFYPNAGDDWHVILSSSGAQFRSNFRVDLGEAPAAGQRPALPCPGDFDGDGKTDFCVMSEDNDTVAPLNMGFSDPPASVNIYAHLRLSSYQYKKITYGPMTVPVNAMKIPMVGKWTTPVGTGLAAKDKFAVMLLETTAANKSYYLGTYIWEDFAGDAICEVNSLGVIANCGDPTFSTTNSAFINYSNQPSPGNFWRPCHSDVDGNGSSDICFLEWPGGNPTAHVAGNGTLGGMDLSSPNQAGPTTSGGPFWSLHYPRHANAPGLYSVIRNSHQVVLFTEGADGYVTGADTEYYNLIEGGYYALLVCAGSIDQTFATPSPQTNLTYTCGNANIPPDGTAQNQNHLNNPTAVAGLGDSGDKLFLANYGTKTVQYFQPGADNYVDGDDETLQVYVGYAGNLGTITPAFGNVCPPRSGTCSIGAPCSTSSAGANTNVTCPLDCFSSLVPMHPNCTTVQPISLEVTRDGDGVTAGNQPALFIGDDRCIVWMVSSGADATFDTADDRMEILAGSYTADSTTYTCVNSTPADGSNADATAIGAPISLSSKLNSSGVLTSLYIGISNSSNLGSPSTGAESSGAVLILNTVSNIFQPLLANRDETISRVAGADTFPATTTRPVNYTAATSAILRNPTQIVASSAQNIGSGGVAPTDKDPDLGIFISTWTNNQAASTTPYENGVLQYYLTSVGTTLGARLRWFNNYHSNSWGMVAPGAADYYTNFSWANRAALATIPIQGSGGVALSHDQRYLYVSETSRGRIMVVALDQDADDLFDYLPTTCSGGNCATFDLNPDGDANNNIAEGAGNVNRDPLAYEPNGVAPTISAEVLADARIFVKGTNSLTATSSTVYTAANVSKHILEMRLDRFAGEIAGGTVPETEVELFNFLGANTVVAMTPRRTLHADPVYASGPSMNNEAGQNASYKRLSPIIMASRTPTSATIKDESGQTLCGANWNLNEDSAAGFNLTANGSVTTGTDPCTGSASFAVGDARTRGVKRIIPSHWSNQWHPFGTPREMNFIDRDGVNGRDNPAVYVPGGNNSTAPWLMLHIGNIDSTKTGVNCPGYWVQGHLTPFNLSLTNAFSLSGMGAYDTQFTCGTQTSQFFSPATVTTVPRISTMVDYHTEIRNLTGSTTSNYTAMTGTRFSTTGGPTETAYRILEEALRVTARNSTAAPYRANVTMCLKSIPGVHAATDMVQAVQVKVEYVFPILPVLNKYFPGASVVITRKEWRQPYNFGRCQGASSDALCLTTLSACS